MDEKFEYRVIWKREKTTTKHNFGQGLKEFTYGGVQKRKFFQTLKGAENFAHLIEWGEENGDHSQIEYCRIQKRPVGEWADNPGIS